MTEPTLNIPVILRRVRRQRYCENVVNTFKFAGVLILALIAGTTVMIIPAPDQAAETIGTLLFALDTLLGMAILTVFILVFVFWPCWFFAWANIRILRQRILRSLVYDAVQAGKPLQDAVRAYAAGCSARYAARLQRFANSLDSGCPLEDAIRKNRTLFRYDAAGILRLGSENAQSSDITLRELEQMEQDERDYEPLRNISKFRIVYLCVVLFIMTKVTVFSTVRIAPAFFTIFEEFGTELPGLTSLMFLVYSQLMDGFFGLIAWLVAVFLLCSVIFYAILQTHAVIARPVGMRGIFRNTDSAKFLVLLAAGLRQGIPIPAILEMYRQTVPSRYLRKKGLKIQKAVERGGNWIDAVLRAGFVSRAEASLQHSSQRAGNTQTVLGQLAQSKERTQFRQDDLRSKMMFIPLVFLFAIFTGAFALAMFLPLVELVSALS